MAQIHVLCLFPRIKVYLGGRVCAISDRSQEVGLEEASAPVELTTWTMFHRLSSVFFCPRGLISSTGNNLLTMTHWPLDGGGAGCSC